ncbi:MFS transporter [Mucilaginibacter sp. L196]|uniref:MFS transporter n=1 Tax=Mucilaginibacter sp. L196 TaxID=1641870 RepID=UPI00131ECBF4|nr:MFS transporter [Mucilaginibacter sp. L196]
MLFRHKKNTGLNSSEALPTPKISGYLFKIFAIIFPEFLIMGISLGVLPAYVHNQLLFGNLVVGVVIGTQYAATLCTRHFAGRIADTKGGRASATTGLIFSSLSAVFCLLSSSLSSFRLLSLAILIGGRILLGIGESFLVIGIFTWGFNLVGSNNTGKVMVWNGMGMYGGMACGAPLGVFLATKFSLGVAFGSIMLFPLLSFGIMLLLPDVVLAKQAVKLPFYKAVQLVWKSGTGLALSSFGFGGIASFITLYFIQQSWQGAYLAITAFGAGYIVVRIFLAHLPDKFGGGKVAMISLLVEIVGQVLIWKAPNATAGICGAGLTGIGMSLVFPSFGVMALKNVLAENRGIAIAAYNAFFDLGIGLTAPLAGLIAEGGNYSEIYLFGAIAAGISIMLASLEYNKSKPNSKGIAI